MTIVVSTSERIATITLNRPEKCNALDNAVVHELIVALKKLASDSKINVLLIKAKGEHFCAGADIGWMQKVAQSTKEENIHDATQLATLMQHIQQFPKPVIVLTHGVTMGGGLGIIAASDIAIATENATFAFSEVKMGIAPSVVSPYVVAAIGERMARYYFLTAEKFNAAEAHRIGLIHQVCKPEMLEKKGKEIAETLLNQSPNGLTETKILLRRIAHEKISDALLHFTAEHLATVRTSADAHEGLKAFLEKRTPNWDER